jgi:DNA-binding transcriptional LysR family regulator
MVVRANQSPTDAGFDPGWLDTLSAVVETGSFTQAGTRRSLTQSAVSQQIAALERWAGAPLVHRRPVAPTEAGLLVLTHHADLRAAVTRLGTDLADLRLGRTGTVRIAAFLSACRTLVPVAVAEFRRTHPRTRVELSQKETAPAIEAVQRGAAHVAVTFGYGPVEVPDTLVATPLHDEPVHLAVPVGHHLTRLPAVDLRQVDPAEVIAAPDASMPAVPVQDAGLHYDGDDFSVLLALVSAGLGVAPVPGLAATPVPAGVELLALTAAEPVQRRAWVVSPAGAGPPTASLIDALLLAGRRATHATLSGWMPDGTPAQ